MPRKAKAITDLRSYCRQFTEHSVNVLFGVMTNKDAPLTNKIEAAKYLLDRGWGRAPQALDVTVDDKRDDKAVKEYLSDLFSTPDAQVHEKPSETTH